MTPIQNFYTNTSVYKEGSFLLDAGETGTDLCFLISGAARVFRITEQGQEITLAVRFCRGTPLLLSACIKSVGIEFLSDSELCRMSANVYLEASSNDLGMRQQTIAQFMDYIEQCHQKLEDLALRTVEDRIARQLVDLANQQYGVMTSDFSPEFQFTQNQLAVFVSASRPSVNIALQKLQQRGLVLISGGSIKIISMRKLSAICA